MTLKKYLKTFDDVLQQWRGEDMAIGGIWALKLHGLNVRNTEDLDIIVYSPSQKFIDFLVEENTTDHGSQPNTEDELGFKWRSYKIHRDGLTIDFILEHDEERSDDVLAYYFKGKLWPVQSIDTIIEKKKKYNRPKDLQDFKAFKRDNF